MSGRKSYESVASVRFFLCSISEAWHSSHPTPTVEEVRERYAPTPEGWKAMVKQKGTEQEAARFVSSHMAPPVISLPRMRWVLRSSELWEEALSEVHMINQRGWPRLIIDSGPHLPNALRDIRRDVSREVIAGACWARLCGYEEQQKECRIGLKVHNQTRIGWNIVGTRDTVRIVCKERRIDMTWRQGVVTAPLVGGKKTFPSQVLHRKARFDATSVTQNRRLPTHVLHQTLRCAGAHSGKRQVRPGPAPQVWDYIKTALSKKSGPTEQVAKQVPRWRDNDGRERMGDHRRWDRKRTTDTADVLCGTTYGRVETSGAMTVRINEPGFEDRRKGLARFMSEVGDAPIHYFTIEAAGQRAHYWMGANCIAGEPRALAYLSATRKATFVIGAGGVCGMQAETTLLDAMRRSILKGEYKLHFSNTFEDTIFVQEYADVVDDVVIPADLPHALYYRRNAEPLYNQSKRAIYVRESDSCR